MRVNGAPTVAVLARRADERLGPVVHALHDAGLDARLVVYRDEAATEIRGELLRSEAVLVWVDPIGKAGEDRRRLDEVLCDVASNGVLVSAHPDVVRVMGTKEVLFETRQLGWGSDVYRYATLDELRGGLRARLAAGPRVLKPRYGNAGIGVWKVELADSSRDSVRVHGAEVRDTVEEVVSLDELLARCDPEFARGGCIVDQPFQPRVVEGLIRGYLVVDRLVGFARQGAESLLTEPNALERVMGLPSPKTMYPADHAEFAHLRRLLEEEWVPAMLDRVGITTDQLPVLWDADFLRGPGDDSFVLCEINCSCVTPFPPAAPAYIARAVAARLQRA